MPAVETFLTLEDTLRTRLLTKWQKIATPMVSRMAKAVAEGRSGDAQKEIEKLNLSRIVAGESKFIRFHSVGSYLYGASNMTGEVATTEAIRTQKVPEIIGPAEESFRAMIEDIDRTLRFTAADLIEQTGKIVMAWQDRVTARPVTIEFAEALPAPFNISEFAEFFGEAIIVETVTDAQMRGFVEVFMEERISATGGSVVTAASSTHTSRLASYGFLTEAKLFGVEKYEVSEQLDGRTCKVCKRMHGKIFDTGESHDRLDGILRISDPSALKQAAPWPNQSKSGLTEIDALSNGQLQSRGLAFPPYHPNCRGVLLPIGGGTPPLAGPVPDSFDPGPLPRPLPVPPASSRPSIPVPIKGKELSAEGLVDPINVEVLDRITEGKYGSGEPLLSYMYERQGFNGKPALVSKEVFEEAAGATYYRGVAGKSEDVAQHIAKLKQGEYFAGNGIYGNGTYSVYGDTARSTAVGYADGVEEYVTAFKMSKNAKIISHDDLREVQTAVFREISEATSVIRDQMRDVSSNLIDGKITEVEAKASMSLLRAKEDALRLRELGDLGTIATMKGYDAIDVTKDKYMVVLNRTAMIMEN